MIIANLRGLGTSVVAETSELHADSVHFGAAPAPARSRKGGTHSHEGVVEKWPIPAENCRNVYKKAAPTFDINFQFVCFSFFPFF